MAAYLNVADFLLAGKPPERIALRFAQADYTYGDIAKAAGRVAAYLRSLGGAQERRVLLIGDNSLFWVGAYLGILKAGAVAVPLPAGVSRQDLEAVIAATGSSLAFCGTGVAGKLAHELAGCRIAGPEALEECEAGQTPGATVERDTLAALMFTSGSTGTPRGVMVTHGNIAANTESIIASLGLTEQDRAMCVLPFHYCFGTSLLHTHLCCGGSLVVDTRFMYPEVVLNRMLETGCTGFAGVPSHYQILLRHSSLPRKSFPQLRYVQQAGGALAVPFLRELRQALPGAAIYVMYGQTEATARLSCLAPEDFERKMGSIGKGIPGVSLRVVNEAGLQVKPGETGEIVATGGNVTKGYLNAPEESAAVFRNGDLYTGDIATVDDEGFIYISGRKKDFLKCGGKRVSARSIEEQVLRFEGVLEAAVIGMPDDVLGDAVKLFAVAAGKAEEGWLERLQMHCRAVLPPQQVPREIVVLRSLPKNSAGKVLKERLNQLQ